MAQTFAQYLLHNILPDDIRVNEPVTKKVFNDLLDQVFKKHQGEFKYVVMDLKNLGDKLSFTEGISVGIDDLDVPNKAKRDQLINTAISDYSKAKSPEQKISILEKVQDDVAKNDMTAKNDVSMMVTSGAMAGKKGQILKMRSSPVVLKDHKGQLVPEMVRTSYSEGLGSLDYWHGAVEARANLVEGQTATSEPGVFNKVTHNIMSNSVVSMDDCGTKNGISLFTKDESIISRYLAQDVDKYKAGELITSDMQQNLLRKGVKHVIVRSPQTCEASDDTVCSKCYGLSIAHGKRHGVGDNVGALSAGALAEVSQQLVLSAKHSTTLAKTQNDLEGRKGLQMATEMPKIYPNKEILCELYGKVYRVRFAPQGGKYLWIQATRIVPDRYIVEAQPVDNMVRMYQYYIPPNRKLLPEIKEKAEVYPGMPLTDGNPNLKDIARLRSLGAARSAATELVNQVYTNTGSKLDRRHFELLGKNMMNYVKIEKAPKGFGFSRGEVVQYNKFKNAVSKNMGTKTNVNQAMGMVLAEDVNHLTIGTEITPSVQNELRQMGVKEVKTTPNLEVSTVVAPLTRTHLNNTDNWISNMNNINIKRTIVDAATEGRRQNIHGYNPISAYAYGVEIRQDDDGKY